MPHGTATRLGTPPGSVPGSRGPERDSARVDDAPALPLATRAEPAGGIPQVVLGLRLLALAVVAGSGALLPIGPSRLPELAAGILAGAGLGVAQYLGLRAGLKWP